MQESLIKEKLESEELRAILHDKDNTIQQLRKTLADKETTIIKITNEKAEAENTNSKLNSLVTEQENVTKNISSQYALLKLQYYTLETDNKSLKQGETADLKNMRDELYKIKSELKGRQNTIQSLESELKDKEAKWHKLKKKCDMFEDTAKKSIGTEKVKYLGKIDFQLKKMIIKLYGIEMEISGPINTMRKLLEDMNTAQNQYTSLIVEKKDLVQEFIGSPENERGNLDKIIQLQISKMNRTKHTVDAFQTQFEEQKQKIDILLKLLKSDLSNMTKECDKFSNSDLIDNSVENTLYIQSRWDDIKNNPRTSSLDYLRHSVLSDTPISPSQLTLSQQIQLDIPKVEPSIEQLSHSVSESNINESPKPISRSISEYSITNKINTALSKSVSINENLSRNHIASSNSSARNSFNFKAAMPRGAYSKPVTPVSSNPPSPRNLDNHNTTINDILD